MNAIDLSLYLVLDPDLCGGPAGMVRTAVQAAKNGATVVQLRAPNWKKRQWLETAFELKAALAPYGIPLIINDHPAVTGEIEAEGVHIGQDDGSLEEARLLAGDGAIVGRSTHSVAQARAAVAEGADYIGFGPLFATPTKPDYTPIGTADIRVVHEENPTVPIFCIGGIKPGNLAEVLAAGARRVVIVSAILQAPDVASMVAGLKKTLAGTP